MTYRESAPPADLDDLVEAAWTVSGRRSPTRVLPDGCMDLMLLDDEVVVAGPDTRAHLSEPREIVTGLRFRPGGLPRLLGVPAAEVRNTRIALGDLRSVVAGAQSPVTVARRLSAQRARRSTTPWAVGHLHHVTRRLAAGAEVAGVADELGWSTRTLQRHCLSVYGYGPATLRRILRFRRAARLLDAGVAPADVAARSGYADQPHLSRDVREFAGVAPTQLAQVSAANRSTVVPSGSVTDA